MARARQDINAVERLAGMGHNLLDLLVPRVEAVEIDHDVAGEITVRQPERVSCADRQRFALRGMHRERDRGIEDGELRQLWHAVPALVVVHRRSVLWERHQLAGDVAGRHHVRRHHPSGLPHQYRPGGVDDRLAIERCPDPLLDGLMAKLPRSDPPRNRPRTPTDTSRQSVLERRNRRKVLFVRVSRVIQLLSWLR